VVEPLVADPSQLCPFLAFVDDPDSRALVATAEHRCYSTDAPSVVSQQHQVVFCLQTRHADCSRFQPFIAAGQEPAAAAAGSRSRNWPLSAVAIIVAVIVGGVAVGAVVGNPLSVEPDAGRTPTPIATLAPTPSPAVTGTPFYELHGPGQRLPVSAGSALPRADLRPRGGTRHIDHVGTYGWTGIEDSARGASATISTAGN
jgi:hypothetical protein